MKKTGIADMKMPRGELRDMILSILREISDPNLRMHSIRAFNNYLKTRSITEKKIFRARILTFYSIWLLKRINKNTDEYKKKMDALKKLLMSVRK